MKRLQSLAAGAVMAVFLAACGGGSAPASGGVTGKQTVTMWMYPLISDAAQNTKFWNQLAAGFHAGHPNITVDISQQTWASRQEAVTAALASGKPPDLMLMIPDQIPQYAAQGTLQPVSDVLGSTKSAFRPSTISGLSYQGKLYAVPLYQDVGTVVYNKKLLTAAGIDRAPETWSEMMTDAPKLAANGVSLLDYPGSPQQTLNLTFYQFLWQAGGSVFSPDGKRVVINSRQGVAALTFLVNLEKARGMPADAATQVGTGAAFQQGKAAMVTSTDLKTAEQYATSLGRDNLEVGMPLRDVKQKTFGNPGGLVLTRASQHKAAAQEFLKYLISPAVETRLSDATGYYPPRNDVHLQSTDPWIAQFGKALSYAYAGDQNAYARRVMATVATYVQAALLGKQSPRDALDAAAAEANSQVSGGG